MKIFNNFVIFSVDLVSLVPPESTSPKGNIESVLLNIENKESSANESNRPQTQNKCVLSVDAAIAMDLGVFPIESEPNMTTSAFLNESEMGKILLKI